MWGGFVIIFFLVIPGIIAYASGWRFDPTKQWFVRTSTLIIASYPKEANITIEGEKKSYAPGWIKFLSPGSRHIIVTGQKGERWEKTLKLIPGEVTFAEHIILFSPRKPVYLTTSQKSNPRRALASLRELSGGGALILARERKQPGGDLLLRQSSPYELMLFDPKTNQEELLQRRSNPITRAEWFPLLPGLPERSGWIVFADRHEIMALEIDARDKRHMITLATTDRIDEFAITSDGRELLIAGQIKGRDAVFKIPLFYNSTTE